MELTTKMARLAYKRALSQSPRRRKQIARAAARTRWENVRAGIIACPVCHGTGKQIVAQAAQRGDPQ